MQITFSSISLASNLLQADTNFCGTIRLNGKDFPKAITNGKLQRDESIKRPVGDPMVCCWKDKRDVFFVTTNSSGNDVMKPGTRFRHDDLITVPKLVIDYNPRWGEWTTWTSLGATMM